MQTRGLSVCSKLLIVTWALSEYAIGEYDYCAYFKQPNVRISSFNKSQEDDGDLMPHIGEVLNDNRTERCPSMYNYCYTLWQEDYVIKNLSVIMVQGCWRIGAGFDCSGSECISNKRPLKASNNTKFCCCTGYKCNENFTVSLTPFDEDDDTKSATRFVEHASYDTQTVIIAVVTMCSIAIVIVLAACVTYHMCSSTKKPNPDTAYLMAPPPPSSPMFNIDSLKVKEGIGRGRYGHVYRGTLYNQTVAVKIFAAQNRNYYLNERYIYCLPFMDHSCLLKLIGAEERTGADERPEYLLVLSYSPVGCLQDYLTNNTFDWLRYCKMSQSVTQGLAHLHTEIKKDGKVKMCIAHRDLTSRNILVKPDGSCMLCDFGFAICISGSKYYVSGEEQIAESTSLTDVGTLRYMAPEVLEGAVNLRDCESSLKQIDIYALGLVLWETATRCTELFQGVEVPEYRLPFVAEIGTHPSMEQMQVLVAKHKARPLFPDIWKDTNPGVRSLKETIEDCWDQDAEARLTALCVEERLSELPILWERHKAGMSIPGVSPTVNPTSSQRVGTPAAVIHSSANSWGKGPAYELPVLKSNSESSTPNNGLTAGRCCGDCSMSEHTAETSITVSPSELTPNSCASCSSNSGSNMKNLSANNNVIGSLRVTVPLQPYQGKNPIMERNLIIHPVEEMAVSGNSLVEKKDVNNVDSFTFEGDLFNSLLPSNTSESNALVTNDELSHSTRTSNPIPYVQNAVHVTSTIPKQQNVPGNGHALPAAPVSTPVSIKRGEKQKFLSGLRNFFRLSKSSDLSSAADRSPVSVPLISDQSNGALIVNVPKLQNGHLGSRNTKPKQAGLETEVYITGAEDEFNMTQTIVRPVANRQVYTQTVAYENEEGNGSSSSNRSYLGATGVAQSQTHPFLTSEYIDSAESSPDRGAMNAVKRPNTLPVARLGSRKTCDTVTDIYLDIPALKETYLRSDMVALSNNSSIESERTPSSHTKSARSSLYDDRIMSMGADSQSQFIPTLVEKATPQASSSVPHSIDIQSEQDRPSFHHHKQQNGHADSTLIP